MSAIDQFDNAAFSEQQQRSRCDISSSRMGPPGKAHRVLGAITLVLAAGLLFLILIPSLIPLLLAWCVVEVLYWMLVTCPTAKQLNAQPAEGHWPPAAEKVDLTHFNRFLKVSVFPIRIHPSCCSTKGPVWHPAAATVTSPG